TRINRNLVPRPVFGITDPWHAPPPETATGAGLFRPREPGGPPGAAPVPCLAGERAGSGGRVARHIGIAAVSPEGSALCYREIFRHAKRLIGERGHPPVTLHNEPFEEYISAALRDDWHA